MNKKASTRIRGLLDAIKSEKMPLANRIGGLRVVPVERKCYFLSIRRFSTDGLSNYIPASHGFTIGLGRLKPTFLKRTGDFVSESINKKSSFRIGVPQEAIKCAKIPLANGISYKNPSTDEFSTYILASHGFIIGLRRATLKFLKRTGDFLSENINRKAST